MSPSVTRLWISLALCVVMETSEVFYKKTGQEVTMPCGQHDGSLDWKHNNVLIIRLKDTGLKSKGPAYTPRTKFIGNMLKISPVEMSDSGLYTCTAYNRKEQKINSWPHTLHVVSASASPSTVLISSVVTLKCEAGRDSKAQVQWLRPPDNNPYGSLGKVVILQSVTLDDAGRWVCQIKDEKGTVVEIEVDITVVGPLKSSKNVVAPLGGAAALPCLLPSTGGLSIVGGGWTRDPPTDLNFPTLSRNDNRLQWKGTKDRVAFSDDQLFTDFDVILNNVESSDAGVYVCTLKFEGEKSLSTKLNLTVEEERVSDVISDSSDHVEITVPLGGAAQLPCTHSSSNSQRVVGGRWLRDPPANFQLPNLMSTELKGLHWNNLNVTESKVTFSDQQLSTDFNVTLNNVEHSDAGVYVCTLILEDGKNQSTKLMLKVNGEMVMVATDARPPFMKAEFWQKPVLLDLALWIWVAVAAGSLLLIVLTIVIVSVQCKRKRKRRKSEKNRLIAEAPQEDMPMKDEFQPKRTKRPQQGMRDRPLPPPPNHQYRGVNQIKINHKIHEP